MSGRPPRSEWRHSESHAGACRIIRDMPGADSPALPEASVNGRGHDPHAPNPSIAVGADPTPDVTDRQSTFRKYRAAL